MGPIARITRMLAPSVEPHRRIAGVAFHFAEARAPEQRAIDGRYPWVIRCSFVDDDRATHSAGRCPRATSSPGIRG